MLYLRCSGSWSAVQLSSQVGPLCRLKSSLLARGPKSGSRSRLCIWFTDHGKRDRETLKIQDMDRFPLKRMIHLVIFSRTSRRMILSPFGDLNFQRFWILASLLSSAIRCTASKISRLFVLVWQRLDWRVSSSLLNMIRAWP
jgi:hypothetical protein